MKNNLDHLGVAVKNLEKSLTLYRDVLGFEVAHTEVLENEGIKVAIIHCGQTRIELMQPIRDDSVVERFLQKRGEGLHHISFKVPDIHDAFNKCKQADLLIVDKEPRPGSNHTMVFFLHPKSANGVLVEFCQLTERSRNFNL